MGCFGGMESMIIGVIILVGAVAIVRVLLAYFPPPGADVVVKIVNILLWVLVACVAVWFFFTLLGCVLPMRR